MRSPTLVQYQSSRTSISNSTSQYTKPSHEYGRPPTSLHEYGRPSVTPWSYHDAPRTPASSSYSTITYMRHKSSWLEEARESTANFKKNGSPVPLVWVLIEDNSIPLNAVPFGEDRNGQAFFIARAHLGGGLHFGKVGYHTSGALISYFGREHLASQHATGSLVPGTAVLARQQQGRHELKRTASSSWSRETRESTPILQATLHVDDIPRSSPSLLTQEEELRRVAEYKTAILIDDSISMAEGDSWSQMREALAGIVDLAIQYGSKGLDLHFMHQDQFAENMRSRFEVQTLFGQFAPT
ncbi:hypothetical protein EV702DRAFT_1122413, partial [Suillus placidus]